MTNGAEQSGSEGEFCRPWSADTSPRGNMSQNISTARRRRSSRSGSSSTRRTSPVRPAANRALDIFLGHELDVRVLSLPANLDPCDFLLTEGAGAFRALVEKAGDP